jgi:LacI family repressor for deo operon, udp, cdd, tsx, nupC, and nupG
LQGIQDTARNKGYYILVCETSSSSQIQSFYLNMAKQRLADGIISVDPSLENVLVSELNQNYPVIQCGESTVSESIPYVAIDDELAAYRAVKYLLAIGHTRVALITSNENFRYAMLRQAGYEKALKEAKVPLSNDYIVNGVVDYEGGRQAMISLLALNKPPTAVFAIGDVMAIGALKAVREAGLQVPSDMAVIGFDNIPFSNMTNPTLTTIAQPMYDMGCNAAHMLIRKLTNKTAPIKSIILPHVLIIRESTHA